MDSYELLKFLHIGFVIVALGSTFAFPFLQAFARRQGVGASRLYYRFVQRQEKFLVIPGAVLVFLMGIGLYFEDTTGYNDENPAWLTISIVWFLVAFLVAGFVMRKTVDEALHALDGVPDDGPFPERYEALAKREQVIGGLLGLSIIGITLLMVWKPGN